MSFTITTSSDDDFSLIEDNNPDKIYEQFDQLRTECPVAHTSQTGGFWLLTRYDDVKRAASDTDTFVSSVKAVIPSDPRGIRRPPLNTDPPAHTPYRTALDRTLKPARLKRLAPVLERHAQREFDALLEAYHVEDGDDGDKPQASQIDISAQFGASFAAWVEVAWLNLEDEIAPVLASTAAKWVNAWRQQNAAETSTQSARLYDLARELFADRKKSKRDPELDPASSLLLEVGPDGRPLDDELLVGALRQSLVVGMVAPPILIGDICAHLSRDRSLQTRLRADPALIPAAVEEFIRLYVPYRGFCRTPKHDINLHGRTIATGQPVTMTYAAANRDPEVFDNPNSFIIDRENINLHLGFGRGRHRCAGMPLARMALQIALRVILQRTDDFEVNGPLQYAAMPEMGITSCPLRVIPARPY
ncbi:cytochrome P450 [Penicillium brasilianum]|uniref:Cytochrome P450 n=1 Tax=Penicillium brasilianum TaxID=104259 RepID=A0A1S9S1J9_PENBI|nr:cytochrome P450 [Penicillium brasilianum]